ncbi:MAG: class IV adenylate cyclase, partial [bacterium]|nr:class IV adenylate cyclase [bacterium]
FKGIDKQTDTYFDVKKGRLKLREGNIESNLIYYNRENTAGPKKSDVILYPVGDGSSLKDILTETIGILTVVDKQREIYFIENVKFHIDIVKGLGSFIEIEAIDLEGNIGLDTLREQCDKYMEMFEVNAGDLIDCSYSDMILSLEK